MSRQKVYSSGSYACPISPESQRLVTVSRGVRRDPARERGRLHGRWYGFYSIEYAALLTRATWPNMYGPPPFDCKEKAEGEKTKSAQMYSAYSGTGFLAMMSCARVCPY